MRIKCLVAVASIAVVATSGLQACSAEPIEDYLHEEMPSGFRVVVSEVEGPVFANALGHTLYVWPKRGLRAGSAGEDIGKPTCGDEVLRLSSGIQSPYPPGFEMPEISTRPACTKVWPPVFASDDAKSIGKWSVIQRLDGRKQWAYERRALYTSVLDIEPGDVLGGTKLPGIGEGGAERKPVGPESNVPAQFTVYTTMAGRLVTLRQGQSVYTFDRDGRNKSTCAADCLLQWAPVAAPISAMNIGDWSAFERSPGVMQWAFRGRPVYRHMTDLKLGSQDGADVPGWKNVYVQKTPPPPAGFTFKPTIVGLGLGDAKGMTVYRYVCTDDSADQLACDHPDSPQAYRMAMCGGGNPDRCLKAFPYLLAPANAKTRNKMWGTMLVDPRTGKAAASGTAGALKVWTLRNRPIYTFAGYEGYGDRRPDQINANGWGEGNGGHNGYLAIIYRDISEMRDGSIGRGGGG